MFNLKSACLGLFSAILISNLTYADEIGAFASLNNNPHTIYTTQGLKPISDSYKLAKLQFLPDLKDSENGWAGNNIGSAYNKNDCSAYPLKSCPLGATCVKCPFAKKYKLTSCRSGWKISGNTCVAASCSALNSSYLSTVPDNKICSKINEGGLTCFKECRNISCNDYKINCDNGVSGANITSSALCPDCQNANAKCSPKLCKITACATNYKTNADNTACVEKSDVCPNNYFKTCETSIVGEPEYTERGTACYQCKPQIQTCAQYIAANRTDLTVINSLADLQHALIDNKNNFVLTNNLTITAALNLSGKKIIGQNSVMESPLCSKMSQPKLTVAETITTNDSTVVENIDFINAMTAEGNYDNLIPMIKGGGKFTSVNMSLDPSIYTYEINQYNPLMRIQGTLTLKDVSATAVNAFDITSNSTLNLQGTITRICNTPEDRGGGLRGDGFLLDKNITINVEKSAKVKVLTPNKTPGFRMFTDWGEGNTVNINGELTFASGKYGAELSVSKGGVLNINYPITVAELSSNSGTININAATTINAETPESSITAIVIYNTGRLNVNAPVAINNFRADQYSNAVEAKYIYVNNTMTFNRSNYIKTDTLDITSKGKVIGATKR